MKYKRELPLDEMKNARFTLYAATALTLIALVAASGAALADDVDNDSEASVELSFGEEISILASSHQVNVSHTVENKAFDRAFDRDAESAVGERARALEEKLDRAEERRDEIDRQLEAGEISEERAMAKRAKLSTETEAVNRSTDVAMQRAAEQGVDVEAVQTLKQRASEMTGPEVREVARSIGGPGVADQHPPQRPGAPDNVSVDSRGDDRSDEAGPEHSPGSGEEDVERQPAPPQGP